MVFPKVFERPVATTPDVAFADIMAWLGEIRAKIVAQTPQQHIKAEWGKALRLASQDSSRKIMVFELWPIPEGTLVRVTMPIYGGYHDDAAVMEDSITKSWYKFIDPLWVRFGYPQTHF